MAGDSRDWVGQVVADGRYKILKKLGQGGMGAVYLADDTKFSPPVKVVIKVPHRDALEKPEFAKRFQREINSLARLQHPHIVPIRDVENHEGVPLAVMQFLSGGDLSDRQRRSPSDTSVPSGGGSLPRDSQATPSGTAASGKRAGVYPVPPQEVLRWLPGIAEALDFIHEKGFIHRDVKPANILFDDSGNSYLSDFGVAKLVSEEADQETKLTGSGIVLGTPEYMAPEAIMGHESDGRVDQYALAVSVYELLCGHMPFTGPNLGAILVKVNTEPAIPLHHLTDAIPEAVSNAVMKGFAKGPAERYASCREFSEAVCAAIRQHEFTVSDISTEELEQKQTAWVATQTQIEQTAPAVPDVAFDKSTDPGQVGSTQSGKSPKGKRGKAALPGGRSLLLRSALASLSVIILGLSGWTLVSLRAALAEDVPYVQALFSNIPFWGLSGCVCFWLVLYFSSQKKKAKRETKAVSPEIRERRKAIRRRIGWVMAACLLIIAEIAAAYSLQSLVTIPTEATQNFQPTSEEILEALRPARIDSNANYQNLLGMELVAILPGKFTNSDGKGDSITQPFWIATKEVTVAQYLMFLEKSYGPHKVGDTSIGNAPTWLAEAMAGSAPREVYLNQTPITGITVTDAVAFCEWLTIHAADGMTYRLPTRDEWVCAYRGGTDTPFFWGDQFDAIYANTSCSGQNSDQDRIDSLSPVGQFPSPSRPQSHPWKLLDLAGNVAEFVTTEVGPQACGGSWRSTNPQNVSVSSTRTTVAPADDLGFRVVALKQ